MSGVFAVARGVFDHPVFTPEPFTEREAWLWLISEAAWKPRQVRVGKSIVNLERGDCAISTRFAAAKWRWSEARVRRFLTRLKNATMICAKTDAGATQITICKYNDYQVVGLPSDAEATQKRRKQEEVEEIKQKDNKRASARDELLIVLDDEHAQAVIDHRQAKKAKLTPRAAKLLAAEFALCPDPHAAADEMIARGWTGFKRAWLERDEKTGPPRQSSNGFAAYARQLAEERYEPDSQDDIEPSTGHGSGFGRGDETFDCLDAVRSEGAGNAFTVIDGGRKKAAGE